MDRMMRIDKQRNGSPPGRTGGCRLACALRTVREARAPPLDGVILTTDGTVITMHGGHLN
jgi:hypothetical protein